MTEPKRPLCALCFADNKQGKSHLGSTLPRPLCVVDIEDGTRQSTEGRGTWLSDGDVEGRDIEFVKVAKWADMQALRRRVEANTEFRSLAIDSVTRLQDMYILEKFGENALEWPDYAQIYRAFQGLLIPLKSATSPLGGSNPLEFLYFTAERHAYKKDPADKYETPTNMPRLQGRTREFIQHLSDVIAYSELKVSRSGTVTQKLYIGPRVHYRTGHRFGYGDIPDVVENPTMPGLQELFYANQNDEQGE